MGFWWTIRIVFLLSLVLLSAASVASLLYLSLPLQFIDGLYWFSTVLNIGIIVFGSWSVVEKRPSPPGAYPSFDSSAHMMAMLAKATGPSSQRAIDGGSSQTSLMSRVSSIGFGLGLGREQRTLYFNKTSSDANEKSDSFKLVEPIMKNPIIYRSHTGTLSSKKHKHKLGKRLAKMVPIKKDLTDSLNRMAKHKVVAHNKHDLCTSQVGVANKTNGNKATSSIKTNGSVSKSSLFDRSANVSKGKHAHPPPPPNKQTTATKLVIGKQASKL